MRRGCERTGSVDAHFPCATPVRNLMVGARGGQQAADFWALGLEPIAVSAISGTGSGDLLDRLVAALPPPRLESAVEARPSCSASKSSA